jgi:hypothetical protein
VSQHSPYLRKWFLKYKALYFQDEFAIPEVESIQWGPCADDLAEITTAGESFVISIDPVVRFSKHLSRWAILHEMGHLRLYPYMGHGKRFKQEMRRLVNLGAFDPLW